jgi:uncharacterized protein (DUF1015 family)
MEIKPFKAYRFNADLVEQPGDCIAPPYDVIDETLQDALYEKNDYNIVRVIKGKTTSEDSEDNNQYTRAADFLNQWIEKGILKQDDTENIYAYIQDFERDGRQIQRSSFISLGKIEDFGGNVKPHEKTHSGPKIDRLNLQTACAAKFGLIFMLYKDEDRIADNICKQALQQKPLVELTDEQDVRHRLFAINRDTDIEKIVEMMSDKNCVIADGHHRYETALNYYKQTHNPNAQYQLFAFANTCNEGLIVLAAHRVVKAIENFNLDELLKSLKQNFEVTEIEFKGERKKKAAKKSMLDQMKADSSRDIITFGIYDGVTFYLATLKDADSIILALPQASDALRSLNVSVLHKLILEDLLGIGEEQLAAKSNLEYVKDTPTAIESIIDMVDSGQKQVAFFLNPEKMDLIRAVAEEGSVMPQKSTYFFPKVYTGLTIYKL